MTLFLIVSLVLTSVSRSIAAPLPPEDAVFETIILPPEAQLAPDGLVDQSRASRNPKLDSTMDGLAAAANTSTQEAIELARSQALRLAGNRVHVQVVTHAPGLENAIKAMTEAGGEVTGVGNDDTLIQGWLPVDALEVVAAQDAVYFIRRPAEVRLFENLQVGNSTTEGLAVINGPAWHAAGYTGSGVKVAIIDGGFMGYTDLLGVDLPASVTVKNFVDGENDSQVNGTTKHGTACAEIVHDIVPGATLYLAKVGTNLDLAEAVAWAKDTHGVDIISTSLGWYNLTPGDGTGEFANLVQSARNAGILWATIAGNDREEHWGGLYSDPNANDVHNFNDTQEINYFGPGDGNAYSIPAGNLIRVHLRWDDWTNVNQDYNLLLLRWNGSSWDIIAASEDVQNGSPGQTPTEFAYAVTSGANTAYGFAIVRSSSNRNVNFEVFAPVGARLDEVLHARSLANLADAPAAMTVAALDVTSPYPQESYSSEGPTNGPGGAETGGFTKPDISGFANVATESYPGSTFSGTSAATPHVAGAAALVLSAYPSYTPDQLQSFLEGRAIDMGAAGMDTVYGHGRLYLGAPPAGTNTAPTISGLPDQSLPVNTSRDNAIDLWAYASDAEDSDADLTFSIVNSPNPDTGVTIDSNRYIDINPATGWTGQTDVEVQVQDTGGLTDSDTFRVTVFAAADKTWNGSVSNDWHTTGNWTPAGVPTSGDDVLIPNVANDPVISTGDAAVNSLTINSGATVDLTDRALTVEGTLTNNGTLRQTQDVTQGSGTEFLRITNLAGDQTKYYGVDITPAGATSAMRDIAVERLLTSSKSFTPYFAQGNDLVRPAAPLGDVGLIVDDGTQEDGLVLRDPDTLMEFRAVLFNHFAAAMVPNFPFTLERIDIHENTNNLQGEEIQLLVYTDASGGDPGDATLLYSEIVTVQDQSGWNVYTLTTPVVISNATDILLGFSTYYADGGVTWPYQDRYPYPMDETNPQGGSYLAWMGETYDPVDPSDLSSFTNLIETADISHPCNWMVRGYGYSDDANIEISPVSFEETLAVDEAVTRTLTISNTGAAPLTFVINEQDGGFTPAVCTSPIMENTAVAALGQVPILRPLAWAGAAPMPTARARLAGATSDGCLLYAIGGFLVGSSSYFNSNEVYDPHSDSWTTLTTMPTARASTGAAVVNETIYVPGGYNGSSSLNVHEAYDIAGNSWSSRASLPVALSGGVVAAANGKVYHIGGNTGSGYTNATYEYDPVTNSWSAKAPAPETFAYAGATVLDGYIYIAGGWLSSSSASTRFWRYDPVGNSWTVLTSMHQGRQSPGVVAAGGYIYAFGGGVGWTALNSTEQYDPATNAWTSRTDSPLAVGRIGMATEWVRGKIWGVGGSVSNSGAEDDNEYLDEGYADNCGSADVPWLSEDPTTGLVPAGSSLTVDVVFDATGLALGDYNADLVIISNDPDEYSVIVPVLMHVVSDTTNTPPDIAGLPDQWLQVNDVANNAIDLWAYTSDAESPDDALTFSIDNVPAAGAGVRIDSNRYIDIFPETDWTGQTDVVVRVTDPGGLFDTDDFRVTVTSTVNTPPTISGLPDITVPVNSTSILPWIDLWEYAEDAEDSDDELAFTITNSPDPNAGVTIDSDRYILVVPATGWVGVVDVEIQVQDTGNLTDTDIFQVIVTGMVNTAPDISDLPDQWLPVNGVANNAIDLWAFTSDAESPDDALTFSIDNVPAAGAGVRIDSNRYIDIFPETDWTGQTDVVVRVTDPGGLFDTDDFQVTVTSTVNTPPTIAGLPDQTVPVNGSANNAIDLWAYASDGESPDDALTFSIDNVPAAGAGVSIESNRYIDIFPETDWTGQTDVVVRVTDPGGLFDTDDFRVTVTSGVTVTSVTVAVSGNQFCANRTTGVKRCFDINPATPISATVRFYFLESERNGQTLNDLLVFRYDAGWVQEPGPYTRGGAGDNLYVEAQNVDDFSVFVLDSDTPTPPDHYSIYLPLAVKNYNPLLLYFDDFSDPNSGWYSGDDEYRTVGYLNGEYQILLKNTQAGCLVTPDLVLPSNYRIEADARQASSNVSSYGLMFGIQWGADTYEGYQVIVYPTTQEYLLERRNWDGSWPVLIDWTYSSAIHQGMGTNHLRVDRIGTVIYFYINGTLVTTFTDSSFTNSGRDAGVRVYSYDSAPVDVRFDNFGAYRTP